MDGAGGAAAEPGILAVERSVGGRRWRLRAGGAGDGEVIAERLGLPEIVGRLLARRGVGLYQAPQFLAPRLRDQLPDPSHLRDMDAGAARLVRAIRGGETIAVFGDYDVDGATSAALLTRFLAAVGARSRIYVPDRLREGYGPNTPALLRLRDEGVGVVVTVDCGTTAHEPLAEAAARGLDVVVVDHHVAEPALPRAAALINPNRLDQDSPHRDLAAVGVAFLLVVAVNRVLRAAGWYTGARVEPDLLQWLDLVALGTVCDVVALSGLNRALVAQGVRVAGRGANAGLGALAAVAGVTEPLDAYHLGYVLGPRVNAGGRVEVRPTSGHAFWRPTTRHWRPNWRGASTTTTESAARSRRKRCAAAIAAVEAAPQSPVLVFAAARGWHPGVIGIVAARLRERYERPACVVALGDGVGRGSGRSVPGLPLGPAVIAARQAGGFW